jgi:hypothetical protein
MSIESNIEKYAEEACWCKICEVTIGNGSVAHAEDCPLYRAEDRRVES